MLALPAASTVLINPSIMNESSSPQHSDSLSPDHEGNFMSPAESSSIDPNHSSQDAYQSHHLITTDEQLIAKTHNPLDALAALASGYATLSEDTATAATAPITPHLTSSSDDDESSRMPPPPPQRHQYDESTLLRELPNTFVPTGRTRSASNPEGMEKWDSYSRRNDRQHFVLPSSILEEELASTRKVLGETTTSGGEEDGFQFTNYSYYDRGNVQEFTMLTPGDEAVSYSTVKSEGGLTRRKRPIKPPARFDPVQSSSDLGSKPSPAAKKSSRKKTVKSPEAAASGGNNTSQQNGVEEEVDESMLEPEELLRRARSRLLEDLSEENGDGEKGVLTLPHSLSKYKEVYNKHGRIGIYTPAERAAIITKFNAKRARRVWNKKIRYNCRKNLADRRMRIKGRFVKRSVEAMETTPEDNIPDAVQDKDDVIMESDKNNATGSKRKGSTPPTSGSPLPTVDENDEEMPDVEDEEADFSPTEDMPYRRTRRYTIT